MNSLIFFQQKQSCEMEQIYAFYDLGFLFCHKIPFILPKYSQISLLSINWLSFFFSVNFLFIAYGVLFKFQFLMFLLND